MSTPTLSRNENIVAWVISVLLAAVFFAAGGSKLATVPEMVRNFAGWGYPTWFMYLTGCIEVLSAVLLLMPRTAAYGGALLICVMVGAIFTHLTHSQAAMAPIPVVLLVLAGVETYLRRGAFVDFYDHRILHHA